MDRKKSRTMSVIVNIVSVRKKKKQKNDSLRSFRPVNNNNIARYKNAVTSEKNNIKNKIKLPR